MTSTKHFLKSHAELLLISVAILMVAILAGGFVWAIIFVTKNIGRAVSPTSGDKTHTNFNLESAQQLDFHGLREATSSSATTSTTSGD